MRLVWQNDEPWRIRLRLPQILPTLTPFPFDKAFSPAHSVSRHNRTQRPLSHLDNGGQRFSVQRRCMGQGNGRVHLQQLPRRLLRLWRDERQEALRTVGMRPKTTAGLGIALQKSGQRLRCVEEKGQPCGVTRGPGRSSRLLRSKVPLPVALYIYPPQPGPSSSSSTCSGADVDGDAIGPNAAEGLLRQLGAVDRPQERLIVLTAVDMET